MKKLMIAAAAAAMIGGAYADGLCDEEIVTGPGCALYDVKFKFKTLAAKDARCTPAQLNAMLVAVPGLDSDADGVADRGLAYLDNATRTFDGVLWQCVTACFEGVAPNDGNGANNGRINFALWEKKNELAISPLVHYWPKAVPAGTETDVLWASLIDESTKFDILGRYGSKATKVAAYWKPSINADVEGEVAKGNEHTANFVAAGVTIDAAGFGSWNTKTGLIKSLSGNAVAKLVPVTIEADGTVCADGSEFVSVLAYMCADFRNWCCGDCVAAAIAPASGTWSLKYNAKKSKSGKLSQIIPDYMVFTEAAGGNPRP